MPRMIAGLEGIGGAAVLIAIFRERVVGGLTQGGTKG